MSHKGYLGGEFSSQNTTTRSHIGAGLRILMPTPLAG